MQLIYKRFVAAAAVAFSATAVAQTVPTTTKTTNSTVPQTVPDEPGSPAQTAPAGSPSAQSPSTQTPSTPTTSNQPSGQAAQVTPATAADVKVGVSVYDQSGSRVGKIRSATKENAVVDTGTTRAQVPIASLGKSDKGLVISMTKSELDAAAKKKTSPK
jgi:hypothetical protein